MSDLRPVHTSAAPAAVGPYSQAIVCNGWVFTAGQIPLDPVTGEMVGGDIRAQTDRVLRNLEAVLVAAGSSLHHVVKTTVFLANMDDFAAMNEVYERIFAGHRPARSTVQAARLPRGAAVEIEAVAMVPRPEGK